MANKCPVQSSPEWVKLVEGTTDKLAWKIFLANNEEVPEMSVIDNIISIYKGSEEEFIDRMNTRIENGMYRERSGKLVPITDSYNPGTWWIEQLEGLVRFEGNDRINILFNYNKGLTKTVELNKKYSDQGLVFEKEQVVFPKATVAKSKNPQRNDRKIYRIKVTKPLIREVEVEKKNIVINENDISESIGETRDLVIETFKQLTGKTLPEMIEIINGLEVSEEIKDMLNFFSTKLADNPTLKVEVDNVLSPSFSDFELSENVITLYSLAHVNQKYPNLNHVGISLAHELLHAYTTRALRNRYSPAEVEFATTMDRLFAIAKKQSKYKNEVAYESTEEWVAYVLTDPAIMREAMGMKLNVWERILLALKKLLGIETIYDHALRTVTEYISNNDTFRPDIQYTLKFPRSLEEDVYLNQDNLTHKQIWDTLNAFSNQFDYDPVQHTYTHIASGQLFYSTTEMMQKIGVNSSSRLSKDKEVAERQQKARTRGLSVGNITHGIAEANLKQTAIDIANANGYEYEPQVVKKIEQILKQFKGKDVTVLSEVLVADIDLLLAGTIDMIVIDENNQVHVYDFKTKEKGFADYLKKTSYGGSIPMTDKERHAFQVSAYKDMFEKMTGLNVASLNIITLKADLENNIVTDIRLDRTHSQNGIITVNYNSGVHAMYDVLKVTQGKTVKDEFANDKVSPEYGKEIDDKLKENIGKLKDSVQELSAKEELVLKSIKALVFKRQVLYRTGRKSEIASQDKLIDDLLAEKDVEKQLITLIKYAYSSSKRIYNEYTKYREEGRELPLNILYGWRDSVSAFNALLNDEDGLEAIISDEHGLKGGPEYRKLLHDTMDTVRSVKNLYEKEGLNQLVDFLAPFYNQLYAELRLAKIKEYRRKKFKGEITNGITEIEYVDKAIDENEEDLQQRTKTLLRKELKKASRDIGLLTRWLDNLLDTKDPVTAAMVKAFVYADETARIESLEKRDDVASVVRKVEEWYKKNGKVPKSNEEFYGFMLEKLNGKLSGHYITSYTSEMMTAYRDIITASRKLDTPEQRKAYIRAWLNDNMPLQEDAFKTAYWEFVEEQNSKGSISDEEFTRLEQNSLYAKNKLSVGEMVEKGIISYEAYEVLDKWLTNNTWDFRTPIEKWANPQYEGLLKILNDPTDTRGDLYRLILKMRREADDSLPFGFRLDTRLPGIIKQNHERISSGQGVGSVIRAALSRELTFKIDDTHRIHEELTDEANNNKYFLPIHFTGRVTKEVKKVTTEGEEIVNREFDEEEQSFDLAGIYYKYWAMANDYNAKAQILPQMELAKFMINKRQAIKRDASGAAILRKTKKKSDGNDLPDEERVINNTMLAQQVNDWFLTCVYGIQEADEGKIGKVDVGKLLNFINSYVSLNLLGLNVVAGTANVILGETLEHIEAFAKEYMTPGDFLYADKFHLRTMKGMIGDIGARDAQGLGTHLIEHFGILDDYGEGDMDRRTKMGQLMNMNTLYATSHLGEHYMQSRFLFGLLANKRAYNSKGEDIGRMLDMYELKDNKLVIKEEVDLVKSKWTDGSNGTKDYQMEFKIKTRGILSRLHGEYSNLGKVAIQRKAIGRMAYLFRHFVVPGYRRRWGKEAYIERLGQYVEGNYVTTGKFVGALGGKIFGKTEENRELQFFSRLIDNLQSFKMSMFGEEWAALTDHEKANIFRTVYEVGFLILAVILANILASIKPEPDEDEEWKMRYWSFVAYQTYRLQNELLFFSPKLDSAMSILRSPAASISFVENLIDLSGQIFHPLDVYQSGAWKGRPKIMKTMNNMAPGVRQFYRLKDIEVQIPWMMKSGLGGQSPRKDNTEYTTPTTK